jgi:hypothetical protein
MKRAASFMGSRAVVSLLASAGAAIRKSICVGILSAVVALSGLAVEARADQYLDRVNGLYSNVKTDKRSDLVMLPLLAKMDAPPRVIDDADEMLLISPDQAAWSEVLKWIDGPNQKAVIDGLYKVTEGKDFQDSMIFAQPYGAEGVSPEMIQARMYSELGDPPLLAAVDIQYMPAMKRLHKLAQLEAVRRASGGDMLGSFEVLTRLAFFGRQLAERPMMVEVVLGYTMMWQAMERIRDIAYEDFRGNKALRQQAQLSKLAEFNAKIEEDRGVFSLDRMPFPTGNRAAAEQLVSMMGSDAGFATTMARVSAGGRPLRLFGEAGKWETAMKSGGGGIALSNNLRLLYDDWAARWRFDPFDQRMLQPFYYTNLDRNQYAVLDASTQDMSELYQLRQFVRMQIVGTRHALAVLGFSYVNRGMWPPQLSSIRPDFIKALTADPYNPNRARGQQPPMEYFVPVRDAFGAAAALKKPHEMTVFVSTRENFQVPLREDTFVLYSTGPDGGKNRAERIQNTWKLVQDTDVLMWPPVSSLWRQHLRDTGELK